MRTDNPPSRVDAAILIVSERFPHWEPSPAMLGFARAVGKVVLGDHSGDAVGLIPPGDFSLGSSAMRPTPIKPITAATVRTAEEISPAIHGSTIWRPNADRLGVATTPGGAVNTSDPDERDSIAALVEKLAAKHRRTADSGKGSWIIAKRLADELEGLALSIRNEEDRA